MKHNDLYQAPVPGGVEAPLRRPEAEDGGLSGRAQPALAPCGWLRELHGPGCRESIAALRTRR